MPQYTVLILNIIIADLLVCGYHRQRFVQFDCDSSVQDWLVAPSNRDGGTPLT